MHSYIVPIHIDRDVQITNNTTYTTMRYW